MQLRSHLLLNLSRAMRKRGNFDSAVERASQAISLKPDSFEAFWARAKARFELATTEYLLLSPSRKKKVPRAETTEEGEREEEESLQQLRKDVSLLSQALADLREAIKIAPHNLQLHRFTIKVKEELEKRSRGAPLLPSAFKRIYDVDKAEPTIVTNNTNNSVVNRPLPVIIIDESC